ncbi:MAG: secondary thiamine-phosphate synthase enzyme YjbQ [bacterium]
MAQETENRQVIVTQDRKYSTQGYPSVVNLTEDVKGFLESIGAEEGLITIFISGSTAGITTIEYEPGLLKDLPELWDRLAPRAHRYHHDKTWGDGNGYAHLLGALFRSSLSVPVVGGELLTGTWQQIVMCDFDNRPRQRQVIFQWIGSVNHKR